jgi:membrane-bound serine protease (ClpP class)
MAFYSLHVLPVSYVGIALVVLAFVLFIAEVKVQSSGILGIGGAVALILGGLLLFDTSASYLRVSWPALIIVALIVLAFFLFVVRAVTRAMRRPATSGMEALVGAMGTVLTPLAPEGTVRVEGEIWRARTEGTDLLENEQIEVHTYQGLTLIVRRRRPEQDQWPERAPTTT